MNKKLINENIQVFIRCRPLLKAELSRSVPVEVHPELNRILVRDTGTDKCTVKSFTFDKVFGSEATQADIYNEIVAPVVQEVVQGFNCTIFAYGQTGTGKTFTIEGGRSTCLDSRSDDPLAGIIPRSMNHLFNELNREYMKYEICVSFLELYNEEIFDLLSKCPVPAKLKMYESSHEKGSVVVQGLQIVPVKSMEEVYNILDKGCKKRRKAATLLNQASSRSHTIFTVTVNIKESSSTIEKVKSGKLNLVDLAGSENIGRSGAIDKRAREAGNINQSLLALGRVITSLCEKAGHIPYRESKLTRLLRDSLGGQTKTAVIATISPSAVHIDETLNTLEYALRAKSITNKPELNAQVTVNSLMQDYLDKIYRLKKEMYEMGRTKGCLYTTDENIINWKSSFESKRDEQFKILTQLEKLKEEEKSLDAAILEAKTTATAKQSLLEDKKIRIVENRAKLIKEKKKCKLHEVMFEVMQPIHESLHDEFHKDDEEIQALQAELNKRKVALKAAANEQKNMREKFEGIRSKRRQWNEKFHQNSESLKRNVTDMHENVHALTSECDNSISQIRKEFEAKSSLYEKERGNVLKTASDFEAIRSNFQVRIDTLLHKEKFTTSKAIEDFQDAYSALSETSLLEPFNKAVSDCQSSLLLISSSLNGWKMDLTSEVNARQRRLKEHVDSQKKTLETTAECAKTLLNKQKESAEIFNNVISECLNLEATNKKVMNDKFLAAEQALSTLDIHCTQSIDAEVEKTNEANFALKNFLEFGSQITEELTNYCENSVNNIDGLKKEVIHAQSYSSEKFEDVKKKVNSSCSNYKDLNSELAKFHNTSQNFNGDCSDVEYLLKNKLKACDQSEVSNQMKMMSGALLRCGDSFKTVLREYQAETETSLLKNKAHLEKLTESSKQLSDIATSKISDSIQSLNENLVKSVTNQDFEMNSISSDETLEISCFYMEKTVISSDSSCSEEILPENECPVCVNKTADETLKADNGSAVQISKESLMSTQAKIEASGSKSFMFHSKSPVRRPRGKNAVPVRKNLQYPDIEKLTQEILYENLEDEF